MRWNQSIVGPPSRVELDPFEAETLRMMSAAPYEPTSGARLQTAWMLFDIGLARRENGRFVVTSAGRVWLAGDRSAPPTPPSQPEQPMPPRRNAPEIVHHIRAFEKRNAIAHGLTRVRTRNKLRLLIAQRTARGEDAHDLLVELAGLELVDRALYPEIK